MFAVDWLTFGLFEWIPKLMTLPRGWFGLIGVDSLRVKGQPVFDRSLCVLCERCEFWKPRIWRI